MLTGHIFVDVLAVGSSPGHIQFDEALWASGFGIDFHYFDREFGRVQVAGGSEGLQVKVSFGGALRKNKRKDW